MRTKPKKRRLSLLRRRETPRSNLQASILTGLAVTVFLAIMTLMVIHQERFHKNFGDEWTSLPWDPAWPALPTLGAGGHLRLDVARAVYAFAGTKPEVLQYIPCYCGCRLRGHRSNHDCYVKGRSADGPSIRIRQPVLSSLTRRSLTELKNTSTSGPRCSNAA